MENATPVRGIGTNFMLKVLVKASGGICFFPAAWGSALASGSSDEVLFPHPAIVTTAIKRRVCLIALPCNPTSTHNQIILIENTRLPGSNGALGFVEMDSGTAVFAGLNGGHGSRVIVANTGGDLNGLS